MLIFMGALLGAGALLGWQLTSQRAPYVHYHANVGVYVNGVREPLTSDSYYEEIANCYADESIEPKARVHLHDHVADLVHVHARAVTWGQFFQNLGWNLGSTYLQTRDQLLIANSRRPLTYLLNGKPVDNPASMVVGSADKLLVSYGTNDKALLQTQYQSIQSSAEAANQSNDPANCGGTVGATWWDRLERAIK
jgi:hypothetical protein